MKLSSGLPLYNLKYPVKHTFREKNITTLINLWVIEVTVVSKNSLTYFETSTQIRALQIPPELHTGTTAYISKY